MRQRNFCLRIESHFKLRNWLGKHLKVGATFKVVPTFIFSKQASNIFKIPLPFLSLKYLAFLLFGLFLSSSLTAQKKLWTSIAPSSIAKKEVGNIKKYHLFRLDTAVFLKTIQLAKFSSSQKKTTNIALPTNNKHLTSFKLITASILSEKLHEKYPSFQSFQVISQNNPLLRGRISWTQKGLYVHLTEAGESLFIERIDSKNAADIYVVYEGKDQVAEREQTLICGNHFLEKKRLENSNQAKKTATDTDLKIFRLAITATEQFTNISGGSIEATLSTIINALTSLNVIYERDLAIRFILQEENDKLIFTDQNPSPFMDTENAVGLWEAHSFFLDTLIGVNNYDLGHVFTTECNGGIAGLAYLAGICTNNKAKAVSCLFGGETREFRRTVYHEIGHQLGASHTWSNCGESANDSQRSATTAVEPGSGSTIMSYGGVCGPFNIVSNAQDYLHGISIQQIKQTLENDTISCFEQIPLENNEPIVTVRESGFVIPINTPFELNATAFDTEGSELTYSWEQFDTGPVSKIGFPEGNAPSFRSFSPVRLSYRTFPRTTDIILNRASATEVLPDTSRNFTFGITVRDNFEQGGSTAFAEVVFQASAEAGPFLVLHPDSLGIEYELGDSIIVQWDIANTDQAPVNCKQVDIYLSFNNGQAFPTVLAKEISNNGIAKVVLPDTTTNRARIKVKCSDNIFFDMSNNRFKIVEKIMTAVKAIPLKGIKLYPNPVREWITLQFSSTFSQPVILTIFDALGRKVQEEKTAIANNSINLNISHLEAGLYFLKGSMGENSFTKRFIIQN